MLLQGGNQSRQKPRSKPDMSQLRFFFVACIWVRIRDLHFESECAQLRQGVVRIGPVYYLKHTTYTCQLNREIAFMIRCGPLSPLGSEESIFRSSKAICRLRGGIPLYMHVICITICSSFGRWTVYDTVLRAMYQIVKLLQHKLYNRPPQFSLQSVRLRQAVGSIHSSKSVQNFQINL